MPRPVSHRIQSILTELKSRLQSGYQSPGRAFFSNRSLVRHFGISYQTAHRILDQLAAEGLISRQRGSGSVVAGERIVPTEVVLVFPQRAEISGTFSNHLRTLLEIGLKERGIPYRYLLEEDRDQIRLESYPVFWDFLSLPPSVMQLHQYCLVLNRRPAIGLASRWVDSISLDDYVGGLIAGEIMRDTFTCTRVGVVGGPKSDERSNERIRGFMKIYPHAVSFLAGSWGHRIARSFFKQLKDLEIEGLFCVNDRLAVRVLEETPWEGQRPYIMGFDNSPTALEHQLTTVGIPWEMLIEVALETIQLRLNGNSRPAMDQILRPEPVIRNLR